jgi:hypothetical protein
MTSGFREPTRRQFLFALGFPWFRRRNPSIAGIEFDERRHGRGAWRFLHIHGDEATAREALEENVRHAKGRTFFVRNDQRMAPIRGGRIDPNRMFSREGAERSLRRLNAGWTDPEVAAALDALDRDRAKFLRRILPPPGGLMAALHNNARGYAIGTEVPVSEEVHLPSPLTPHEFALATDPRDFEILRQAGFNAVLQSQPQGPDDGSLSRACARAGVRYVNIEAHMGQLASQREMLRWILANLPERRNV